MEAVEKLIMRYKSFPAHKFAQKILILEGNPLNSIFLWSNWNLSEFVKFLPNCWINITRVSSRDLSLVTKYRLISAVFEINDVTKYMYPFVASGDYRMITLCRIELLSDFLKTKMATTSSNQSQEIKNQTPH